MRRVKIWRQVLNKVRHKSNFATPGTLASVHEDQYPLSPTCQIPDLDKILRHYLGFRTTGFFVEFGAFDGEYASNASGLADLGWGGLFIEPVTEFRRQCQVRHRNNPQVQIVGFAVSDSDEELQISVGGPLSSLSRETVMRFNEMNWSKGLHVGQYETVSTKSLDAILTMENVRPGFDLLSVDVEGFEFRALSSFDLKKWSPKIVIVELHDNNANYPHEWDEAQALNKKFAGAGYRVVFKDLSNTVFVAQHVQPIQLSS